MSADGLGGGFWVVSVVDAEAREDVDGVLPVSAACSGWCGAQHLQLASDERVRATVATAARAGRAAQRLRPIQLRAAPSCWKAQPAA
jgi:hypothetical protein